MQFASRFGRPWDLLAKAMTVAGLVCLVAVAWTTWEELRVTVEILRTHAVGRFFLLASQTLVGVNVLVLLWRLMLWAKYRPAAACTDAELPTCTVVVPAYNEGRHVLDTLRSLVASDYPPGKLQVIAVDDGSRDDTWSWMRKAAEEFPGRVAAYRLPTNRGKRHALHLGFLHSTGEVLVTVDSDSVVEPQALRRLASPFARDQRVGAVAGNVRVLNSDEGIIPRMLDVSFAYSFDFIRAAQSVVNTVMCTPGALSAYRRSVVMKVLPEWVGQTFMGRPSNIGEDRAMTNLILREGGHVAFQSDAVVLTKVPVAYRGLCKMYLRWARSNIREMLVMFGFAFRRFRPTPASGARINLLLQAAELVFWPIMMVFTLVCLLWRPDLYTVSVLTGTAAMSALPAAFYAFRYRSSQGLWSFPYGVFYLLGLSWINAYSLLTPHRDRWLTRDMARPTSPRQMPAPVRPGGHLPRAA